MFSNEAWLITGYPRKAARDSYSSDYDSVLNPPMWEMGRAEAEALALIRQQWQPRETYWLYQPSFRSALW